MFCRMRMEGGSLIQQASTGGRGDGCTSGESFLFFTLSKSSCVSKIQTCRKTSVLRTGSGGVSGLVPDASVFLKNV